VDIILKWTTVETRKYDAPLTTANPAVTRVLVDQTSQKHGETIDETLM
jgi:hypothetical protein